jgi:predicted amidohydrolase
MPFRIALAQSDSVLGDVGKNIARHHYLASKALKAGAQLVIFPELSLTGYSVKDLQWDLAVSPASLPKVYAPLLKLGKSISILAGGIEEGGEFGIYNSALMFDAQGCRSVHRKVYPPTYGMFEEMRYFGRGASARAFDTPFGRIGVLVCEDLWHLPLPYLLALDGAQIIITLVASPTRVGGGDGLPIATVNTENHKAIARLLSVYLVFCNRVGFEDGVSFWGGSEVVGPDGTVVASGKLLEEDMVTADIDLENIRRARRMSRHFLDDDPHLVQRELRRILCSGDR